MKRIFASLFCTALLFTTPSFADLVVPGENTPVLSENSAAFNEAKFNIVKRIDNGSVTLKVFTADGKEFWTSSPLGEQEKKFVVDGAASPLAIKDLTGDGVPELITAAMTGLDSSALYVFKFDGQNKTFTPMNFKYEKENLSRDFLVSDMYQENGEDLFFLPENKIRALGKIYSEGDAPVPGFYVFSLKDNEFVCSEVTPVPVDDTQKAPESPDAPPADESAPATTEGK